MKKWLVVLATTVLLALGTLGMALSAENTAIDLSGKCSVTKWQGHNYEIVSWTVVADSEGDVNSHTSGNTVYIVGGRILGMNLVPMGMNDTGVSKPTANFDVKVRGGRNDVDILGARGANLGNSVEHRWLDAEYGGTGASGVTTLANTPVWVVGENMGSGKGFTFSLFVER